VVLLLAILLLLGWGLWFFLARVSLYEVSQSLRADGMFIIADFPAETLGRIQRGQSARLRLSATTDANFETIPAVVFEVPPANGSGPVPVTLVPTTELAAALPTAGPLTGQVQIEVEQVSPAMLVIRASGQFAEQPQPRQIP
jgi:membrane fusion protein (multidrug efflux system)